MHSYRHMADKVAEKKSMSNPAYQKTFLY